MPHRQRFFLIAACLLILPLLAAASVLFFEDFEDGTADGFTPIGPGWAVVDGAYQCETTGFEVYSSAVFGNPLWQDVAISFDIRSEDATSHLLRFRVNDFEDFYDINLRSAPWNDVVLSRTLNTQRQVIAQVPTGPFANGTWHQVQVVCEGYQFHVLLDGVLVLSHHDELAPERLRSGQCAVVSYSGGVVEHQLVAYDNVVVEVQVVRTAAVSWSNVKSLFD